MLHLSLDDFVRLNYDEFEAIVKAHERARESQYHDNWERMRLHAAIAIQPHVKKAVPPQKLVPLPWDKQKHNAQEPQETPQQHKQRFEELTARLGIKIHKD